MLCGSVLALNLSDQFAASNEAVQKEQSRLLAFSGWNMALEQLQLYGEIDALQIAQVPGEIAVNIEQSDTAPAALTIKATGIVGEYKRAVSGTVQCFPFPFADTKDWLLLDTLQTQTESGILLLEQSSYTLPAYIGYPLGITTTDGKEVMVEVSDSATVTDLYINGDLIVSGELKADVIYVTGEISGAEHIDCNEIQSGYIGALPYQVRVLERIAL